MRALWSDKQNCSHNVSQKVKRIRRFSDLRENGRLANGYFVNGYFELQCAKQKHYLQRIGSLAHQNRTIAIASDFRVDGAKSPEIPQQEGVLGSDIAARNRKSLATFHRTLKSQCIIAVSCFGNRAISGVRDGHRNRKSQKSLRFRCAKIGKLPVLSEGSSLFPPFLFLCAEKKKAYTTTGERKSFGELFWPQRKTFQAGGGYKNPI